MEKTLVQEISDMMDIRFKDMSDIMNKKFDAQNKEISELKKICIRLDHRHEDMKKDIKDLKKGQFSAEARITSVQSSITTLDMKIDDLRNSFDIMQEEFDAMKVMVPNINERVKKLEQAAAI